MTKNAQMVEKGEISSYSYKTIVRIPPFSTTLSRYDRFIQNSLNGSPAMTRKRCVDLELAGKASLLSLSDAVGGGAWGVGGDAAVGVAIWMWMPFSLRLRRPSSLFDF